MRNHRMEYLGNTATGPDDWTAAARRIEEDGYSLMNVFSVRSGYHDTIVGWFVQDESKAEVHQRAHSLPPLGS